MNCRSGRNFFTPSRTGLRNMVRHDPKTRAPEYLYRACPKQGQIYNVFIDEQYDPTNFPIESRKMMIQKKTKPQFKQTPKDCIYFTGPKLCCAFACKEDFRCSKIKGNANDALARFKTRSCVLQEQNYMVFQDEKCTNTSIYNQNASWGSW